jgi:hypothetical protein
LTEEDSRKMEEAKKREEFLKDAEKGLNPADYVN